MSMNPAFGQDNPADPNSLQHQELIRQLQASAAAPGISPPLGSPTAPGTAGASSQIPYSPDADPSLLLQGYQQRGQNSTGGYKSAAANALGMAGTGATIGSVVPGVGTAIGAGVGAAVGGIEGLFNKHAASAQTDYSLADAQQAVRDAYQTYYGRPATDAEVNGAIAGQGWKPGDRYVGQAGLTSVLNNIKGNAATAAAAQSATPANTATPASTSSNAANANLPQWLQDIYNQAGVTDGGAGAGFTDGAYWSDKQSQADRLKADLAGNGPDQPGPKDAGAALNSGKDQRSAGVVGIAPSPFATVGGIPSLVPTDTNFYNTLQQKIASILGGQGAFDRDALIQQLTQ